MTTLIGKTVTIRPTQGAYQKEHVGLIIWETPTRIKVRYAEGYVRTFIKATGQPYTADSKQFPYYVADMGTLS